ncbi:flagellar basal body rod protein FlgG [Rubeoparvulum massiliense]|uniref:flagellar basal body rod protein FlgG n=1 Tax=Rubeoparvulum massiliense TaxID=1631346 RepID=UPI00065E673A|nr:flagellar basal body rod protein FlgG [Rubeoparvulum massiliense]
MLRSMYSGVSGMRGFQTKLDVIGNNIANVNTAGFKKSRVMFQDILSQTVAGSSAPEEGERGGVNPRQVGLGVRMSAIDTLHTPGSPMMTNVPTDVAINGDGYFLVSPTGEEPYYLTRAGDFKLDAYGFLVNSQGLFVASVDGGPIQVNREEYNSYSISESGEVLGTNGDGETNVVGTIGLSIVANPAALEKIGGSLYKMTPNANPDGEMGDLVAPGDPEVGSGTLAAGMLEMSNVDLTEEFTEMIVAQRGFQANSRIITTSDEILQEVVNLKR